MSFVVVVCFKIDFVLNYLQKFSKKISSNFNSKIIYLKLIQNTKKMSILFEIDTNLIHFKRRLEF